MKKIQDLPRELLNMLRHLIWNAPVRWHELTHRTTLIDVVNLEFERRK